MLSLDFSLGLSSLTNNNSCVLPAVFVLSLHPAVAVSLPIVEQLRHISGELSTPCAGRLGCQFITVSFLQTSAANGFI